MRKSLGEKRKQISEEQIAEITRLYGDFAESDQVKIFPNEAFGFLRITVERPLRLRWEITDDTIAAALATKPVAKLTADLQAELRALLTEHLDASFATKKELVKALGSSVTALAIAGPTQKPLWGALAIHDEDAPVVADKKGNAEPDPELRDSESVPLPAVRVEFDEDPAERFETLEYRTAVDDYMRDEVLPYVPEAWVDHDKTRIGYEIPLTRHFYTYVPPRPLEEIDAEIKALEATIQRLLAEVAR
jgi:type I restriction enzyme M protein